MTSPWRAGHTTLNMLNLHLPLLLPLLLALLLPLVIPLLLLLLLHMLLTLLCLLLPLVLPLLPSSVPVPGVISTAGGLLYQEEEQAQQGRVQFARALSELMLVLHR